jgi:RNA polymerase sigma-70 factor, ECF subfamily
LKLDRRFDFAFGENWLFAIFPRIAQNVSAPKASGVESSATSSNSKDGPQMSKSGFKVDVIPELGQYRELLRSCVERISRRYQAKFDESDIVQETLADAQKHLCDFRGKSEVELAGWLRRMLARNLIDAVRRLRSRKRDIFNERRIQRTKQVSGQSSMVALQAEQTSPSGRAVWNEELKQLTDSLASLPEAQRQAITLHHLKGMTLAQVAAAMNRSKAAVAGLLHRGLTSLQQSVEE